MNQQPMLMKSIPGQDEFKGLRSCPKRAGQRSISRDEFDAAHQGGHVHPHRYRVTLAHHDAHRPRVDDDLLKDAVVDVQDCLGVI